MLREESERQRKLLEEQNQAYALSLSRDAERKEQERLAKLQREEQEKREKEALERKLAKLSAAREAAINKLNNLPPPTGEKLATIAIRILDGSRVDRKFSADAPLRQVYDFIEGTVASKLAVEDFIDDSSSLAADDPIPWTADAYELVLNFPKRRFSIADADKTLMELGLAPGQSMLFMQDRGLGKSH